MSRPLAVRWRDHELPSFHAGALAQVPVTVENAGTTPWAMSRFTLSYHWLDDRNNPIVWDGLRTELGETVVPGATARVDVRVRAPIPPGRYRLSVDLVDESRFWFGELGEPTLDADVDVLPREGEAVPHLGDAEPASDWHERVAAAHREGYAVVGGSVETRRRPPPELAPYSSPGRVANFVHPLVCPSVLHGVEVEWTEVAGLPAAVAPPGEPSLYDGRIRVRPRGGRRRA